MMRILTLLTAVLFSMNGLAASAQSLALVLSNGNYEHGADIANISRHHQQLVNVFRAQGYDVVEGKDLNRLEIRQALNRFESKLEAAETVVISLQGHLVHYGESSWFIPTDMDAASATGVEFRAVSMDFFAQMLGRKPGQSVLFVGESERMIFDMPQVEEGLTQMDLPRGVMMISGGYQSVSNILTEKFLRHNQRVIDVLRSDIGNVEIEGDIPASLVLADRRVPQVNTAEQVEESLGLSRDQRRDIQKDLTSLGYDTRGIDGLFGNGTRTAVRTWQRRTRLLETGYLTRDQITLLRQQAENRREEIEGDDREYWSETGANGSERGLRRYLERYPDGLFANRARAELARLSVGSDEAAWGRAVRADTTDAYRQYLREFPNGIYKDIARARIGTPPQVVENDGQRVEQALRLNSITRLLIEQRVADLGYRTGPRDGNFDLATRQGFRQYQSDRHMPVTGYVTADMIRRLLLNQ